jgi:hypothetical protein
MMGSGAGWPRPGQREACVAAPGKKGNGRTAGEVAAGRDIFGNGQTD